MRRRRRRRRVLNRGEPLDRVIVDDEKEREERYVHGYEKLSEEVDLAAHAHQRCDERAFLERRHLSPRIKSGEEAGL